MDWREQANCKGLASDLFFPERGELEKAEQALAVCKGCVVKEQCLEANIGEYYGIFGGTSGRERKRLRRERSGQPRSSPERVNQAKSLRRHGFSVQEAADELGVHPETIVKWTRGEHFPRVPTERQPKPWCRHCDLERAWTSDDLCKACDTYERKYGRLPTFGVLVERNRRRDERRAS